MKRMLTPYGIKTLIILVVGSSIVILGYLLLSTSLSDMSVLIIALVIFLIETVWANSWFKRIKRYNGSNSRPILRKRLLLRKTGLQR